MIAVVALIIAALVLVCFCFSAWGLMLAAKVSRVSRISFSQGLLVVLLCAVLNGLLLLADALIPTNGVLLLLCTALAYSLGAVLIVRHFLKLRFWKSCLVTVLGAVFALVVSIPLGVAIALPTRMFVAAPFKIPASNAMSPTLVQGDRVLVSKMAYRWQTPQRWDVAVFRFPPDRRRPFIKRVIGLPGESIEIRDGAIVINGTRLSQPAVLAKIHWTNAGDYGQSNQPATIPPNCYFVMGDNSGASHDSRYWGFVCRPDLIGKALYIYWPPDRLGPINPAEPS